MLGRSLIVRVGWLIAVAVAIAYVVIIRSFIAAVFIVCGTLMRSFVGAVVVVPLVFVVVTFVVVIVGAVVVVSLVFVVVTFFVVIVGDFEDCVVVSGVSVSIVIVIVVVIVVKKLAILRSLVQSVGGGVWSNMMAMKVGQEGGLLVGADGVELGGKGDVDLGIGAWRKVLVVFIVGDGVVGAPLNDKTVFLDKGLVIVDAKGFNPGDGGVGHG